MSARITNNIIIRVRVIKGNSKIALMERETRGAQKVCSVWYLREQLAVTVVLVVLLRSLYTYCATVRATIPE